MERDVQVAVETDLAALPVVLGTVTVRGQTWQGFAVLDAERDAITWAMVAAAASGVMERAGEDCRGRGLPQPRVGAWRWHGGWIQPVEPTYSA